VPDGADGLRIAVVLRGLGTLGVDDVSIDVVDPAKMPVTPKTEMRRDDSDKRARELADAIAKLPDRPVNLDFER
jgi:hypothetical protein